MKWSEYIGIILYVILAYFVNKMGLNIVSIALFLAGITIAVVNIRMGSLFFFITSLSFSDFVFENMYIEGMGSMPLGGIYMASFAGATLMVFWCSVLLVIMLLKKGTDIIYVIKDNKILFTLVIIFFFSIVGFCFNIFKGGQYVERNAVSDIRFFVNIFVGFLSVYLCCQENKKDITKLINIFVVIFMTQTVIAIISSYTASQRHTLYNFVTGTESYVIGIIFLFFLFMLMKKDRERFFKPQNILYILSIVALITYLLVTAARGRIFLLGIAFLIFCLYTRKYQYILYVPVVIFLGFQLVSIINPNFIDYFMWKFTTFNPLEEGGESANVRYVSFLNIMYESLSNPYYFVFGKGLGGYFETNFVSFAQDLRGGHAFDDLWIAEGKYYKPHGIALYSLLKFGTVMSVILYFHILKFCYVSIKGQKGLINKSPIIMSIALMLPIFYIVIYSSKLQIIFGMLLAFLQFSNSLTSEENDEG